MTEILPFSLEKQKGTNKHRLTITCMDGISACHYSTSCRCTKTLHIIIVENYPTVSQSIQVWSWNLLRAMKAHIIPSLKEQ